MSKGKKKDSGSALIFVLVALCMLILVAVAGLRQSTVSNTLAGVKNRQSMALEMAETGANAAVEYSTAAYLLAQQALTASGGTTTGPSLTTVAWRTAPPRCS
jgi:Tfp pilus assembly protein PilX